MAEAVVRNQDHPLYGTWAQMIQRCTNPNVKCYPNYGGRGIRVCERWRHSFKAFIADVGQRPTPKHQLDRYPNGDGPYEPGNVRWATASENCLHRRNNDKPRHMKHITWNGETLYLKQWATKLGIPYRALLQRFFRGWSVERAFTQPCVTFRPLSTQNFLYPLTPPTSCQS